MQNLPRSDMYQIIFSPLFVELVIILVSGAKAGCLDHKIISSHPDIQDRRWAGLKMKEENTKDR